MKEGRGGAGERESKAAERRGPVQCRAGTDTQSSAFLGLPWKPHSSPACIPTDCSDSLSLSIYLSPRFSVFHPVFFIPLLIRVFVVFFLSFSLSLYFFTKHALSTFVTMHTQLAHQFQMHCSLWQGERVITQSLFCIPMHSWPHNHCCFLYILFSIFTPPLLFSTMPQ